MIITPIKNIHNVEGYPFTLGRSRIYTEMQYIRTSVIPQTLPLKLGSNMIPSLESVHETLKYYHRDLTRPRRGRQRQKTIGFMSKTIALHVHHAFGIILWRPLHDYDIKLSDVTFYTGREHNTRNFPFSLWTWIKSLRIQLQETSPPLDKLSESKYTRFSLKERKFIFFSDVFIAVVVVVA